MTSYLVRNAGKTERALSQRIRTAAKLALEVALIDQRPPAVYEQIAELAKHLRNRGMSNRAIGRALNVHHTEIAKALAWTELPPR